MKNIIILIGCSLLFTQCGKDNIEVYPTGSFDTMGVHWMTIERNNIIYYFQGTGVKGASIYTDMHEEAYDKLIPIFNPQLPRKLRFFVWTDWASAIKLFNKPEWVGGFALVEECVCHQRADIPLGHEMTHVLSYWAWGIQLNTYSRFINEGIAETFEQTESDKIVIAKKALEGKNIHSVLDVWQNDESTDHEILYPVAGAFVEFLYEKNMPGKFKLLVKNQRIEDAENIYGKEQFDAFIAEFDNLVGL